ncbi:MAG: 3-hydroxyacyl-CoA dehydrogenase [Planctomycetota bacterium]|jgi:3-hydroxyacyl-CoA dehydrogenase
MERTATRNKNYLFFAIRQTSKIPHVEGEKPVEIGKAAVVGMGSMGAGIAQAMMAAGVRVVVRDEDPSALERGTARIRSSLRKRVDQGKLSDEAARRTLDLLFATTDWQDIADADLVVEAVFEDVDVKRAVIGRLEEVCPERTILATNTSTISLDVLTRAMRLPERLIGMHFFNPAHRMPLVEIVRRPTTAPGPIATGLHFAKRLGKTPVLVNSREGFLVNRLFIPYLKEAFWLLEEGAEAPAIDEAMVEFGFPMGPLALIDVVGIDVLAAIDRVLCRAFPRHGELSQIALRLVDEGQLGQKTGSGVYKYTQGDYTPHTSPVTQTIIDDVRRQQGRAARGVGTEEITERLILRMVGEAFYAHEEGIAQRESDLDAATVLGIGFPDFRGGVLRHAHQLGLDRVLARLDELASQCGDRFAPCRLLRTRGAKPH